MEALSQYNNQINKILNELDDNLSKSYSKHLIEMHKIKGGYYDNQGGTEQQQVHDNNNYKFDFDFESLGFFV